MFQSFSRSWELVKTSFGIIREDKTLLLFPLISMAALALVSVMFFFPMLLLGAFGNGDSDGVSVVAYIVGFVYYVVVYYIMIFANAAIVGAAMERLKGNRPTFNDALNIAKSRSGKIFGWALISATVGIVLQAIENMLDRRVGFIGDLVVSLIGAAWNIATFLVVPVLVVENIGPIEAIKRSSSLLRQTWGQQLMGNFGLGLIFFLLFLVGGLPLLILTGLAASISPILGVLVGLFLGAYILLLIALYSAVSGIFTAAVYAYAVHTPVQDPIFDQSLVQNAFGPKLKTA